MALYRRNKSFEWNIDKAAHEVMYDQMCICGAMWRGFPFKELILNDYLSPDYRDTDDYWFSDDGEESQEIRYTLLLFYKELYLSKEYTARISYYEQPAIDEIEGTL